MAKPIHSPWHPKRDRDAEREMKREAVLRAACRVFNEKGFQATTLDEVAASLQVSKPTLYYYVKSKDEILFECVRIGLTMLQDAIAQVEANGGRAVDKLVAAMYKYGEIVTMDFGMCLIRVGEEPLPADKRAELRHMKAGIDEMFRKLIADGITEGSVAPCDPFLAASTIAGALSWIARWYDPDGPRTARQIVGGVITLVAKGLCSNDPLLQPNLAFLRERGDRLGRPGGGA